MSRRSHLGKLYKWAHWIVFMASLYMYYALYFVVVEHSLCHELISVLINVFMLLA